MADDPVSQPVSDANTSPNFESPNRPEPTFESSERASESANTQLVQPQSANEAPIEAQPIAESATTATGSARIATEQPEAPAQVSVPQPKPEAPSLSQQPEAEAVSQSTLPVSEPSTEPPSQETGIPETDQEKQENVESQATTEPQSIPEPEAPEPQGPPTPTPSAPPTPSIPPLHFPFYESHPVAYDFGAQPTEEKVKEKYEEWGIVGHNGIDFGLQEGTEVLACDEGTVIQVGDNGDHGISVTIKHSWGISIYSHLQSFGALVNDQVKKAQVIGSSGQTGFTTGPHLHFGIQPNNPDTINGYLGYIDPTPHLKETSPLPQSPLSPQPPQAPDLSGELSEEKPLEETSVAPAKQSEPQVPQSPLSPQSPQPDISQEDIQKQAVAIFDARLKENSMKGNQAKKAKRDEAIKKIFSLAQGEKRVTNEQVRDLLHVSQSTASDYLSALVNRGMLKTEGKGKATVYLF